jgi:ATP-dependent protease ClpP protease subunit
MYKTYAERSNKPAKYWEKICTNDTFYTAEEAVSIGLADRIILPSKDWSKSSDSEEES